MTCTIYHLAQGSEMSKQDAQKDGDSDAANFFQELQRFYKEDGEKVAKTSKDCL